MTESEGKVFMEALERARKIAKQLAESGKRGAPEDDGGAQAPVKRFGGFGPGMNPGMVPGMNGNFVPAPGQQTQEEWTVPNRMVGLIIGKGGENISRIQDSCGAKLQLGQEPNGDKRSCIIYGTPTAIMKCKEMVNEIIDKEGQRNPHNPSMSQHNLGIVSVEVHIPKHKVGQIIGKGGETIRSLQDKARVRMFLIQDVDPSSPTKPIKITGDPERVEHARKLVEEMIAMPDVGGDRTAQVQEQLRVPRGTVGVIIGKGGETIRDIQNDTGARVQFIDNPQENEKTCLISGKAGQVQEAKRLIEDLLQNSAQAKNGGGGGGGGRQKYECEEIYKVPASKTGVIIGKGGETIRQICERSGAKVELDRNHPQTAEDRIFHMRGSRSCVEAAKRFIEEKLADQARGNYSNDSRSSGGDSWGGGGGGGSVNWMDPNAAAAGDPSAAFWTAYCQQYYQMMGGLSAIPGVPGQPAMPGMPGPPGMQPGMQPGMPVPGMPNNMYMGNPGGLGQEPAPPTQPMDPNAASYYYNAANNPNQPVPASAEAVQTTEDGGQDFSRAWIVYYRSVGMHKEADDLEATLKAKENGGR